MSGSFAVSSVVPHSHIHDSARMSASPKLTFECWTKNMLAPLRRILGKLGKDENSKSEEALFDGVVEVEHDEALPFTLSKGDVVEGIMIEKNRQEFDCYIMTEKNYAKSCGDRTKGIVEKEFIGQSSYPVKWKTKQSGVWYFDFDNYGKQYPRAIQVRLRRIHSAN